jgi:hypothetical protein
LIAPLKDTEMLSPTEREGSALSVSKTLSLFGRSIICPSLSSSSTYKDSNEFWCVSDTSSDPITLPIPLDYCSEPQDNDLLKIFKNDIGL